MQPYNVPQFIDLLKARKFPIDRMQIEVVATASDGTNGLKGVIVMNGEDQFSLAWCRWECFLLLFSALEWNRMFNYLLPYCMGLRKMKPHMVDSDMGKSLHVVRSIKYA